MVYPQRRTRFAFRSQLKARLLGGRAAEDIVFGKEVTTGESGFATSDRDSAADGDQVWNVRSGAAVLESQSGEVF